MVEWSSWLAWSLAADPSKAKHLIYLYIYMCVCACVGYVNLYTIHVLRVSMYMNIMYPYMYKPVCMHARVHACMFPWWLSRGNHARAMRKQLKLSWAIFSPSQVVLVETLGYSYPVLKKKSEHEAWDVPNRAPHCFFPPESINKRPNAASP